MEDNSLDEMNNITMEVIEEKKVKDWRDEEGGTWIWFRYTLFPLGLDDNQAQSLSRACIAKINESAAPKYISWGLEALNKAGQPTKTHLHIVLFTEKEYSGKLDLHNGRLEALRKAFTRDEYLYKEIKKTWTKNDPTIYSMQLFKNDDKKPFDAIRALRYCWKQGGAGLPDRLKNECSYKVPRWHAYLPAEMDIHLEYKCALEEYEHSSAGRYKTLQKRMEPTSCDKLLQHLEQLENPPTTKLASMVEMLKYFAEKEQPANKRQLQGYVVIWLLRRGIVSYDEMAQEFIKDF